MFAGVLQTSIAATAATQKPAARRARGRRSHPSNVVPDGLGAEELVGKSAPEIVQTLLSMTSHTNKMSFHATWHCAEKLLMDDTHPFGTLTHCSWPGWSNRFH